MQTIIRDVFPEIPGLPHNQQFCVQCLMRWYQTPYHRESLSKFSKCVWLAFAIRCPALSLDSYGIVGTPNSLVPPIPDIKVGNRFSLSLELSRVFMSLPSQCNRPTLGGFQVSLMLIVMELQVSTLSICSRPMQVYCRNIATTCLNDCCDCC